ncbi:YceI family protein [Pontimicrobium aquaticum]|uniref:YceI family protein n=1 Tax=Pontimicrobium aquaticum TaxID=2565367 RepID=A0A4U0F0N8_9FLAO|nr:YceI family protein [Pontimicrobium aquaticum]TJY37780.1 YceI family protein [Pontimicrobium aquaticum]
MKKLFTILFFTVSPIIFAQSKWKVDKAHSKVSFNITHLMISEVTGNFDDFNIEATANDTFSNPNFNVEIKTASIDTDNDGRDKKLRGNDYFQVEDFPIISFKTTNVEMTGDKTFKLTGELTIKNITKTVSLDGVVNGVITNSSNQKLKAGLKITGAIDRLLFKVGSKSVSLGDEVQIVINIQMNQQ